MSFIIETKREREKEGPGDASVNCVFSSTESHSPAEQRIACGRRGRWLMVGAEECKIRYFLRMLL